MSVVLQPRLLPSNLRRARMRAEGTGADGSRTGVGLGWLVEGWRESGVGGVGQEGRVQYLRVA